jgi:hypothetical protein
VRLGTFGLLCVCYGGCPVAAVSCSLTESLRAQGPGGGGPGRVSPPGQFGWLTDRRCIFAWTLASVNVACNSIYRDRTALQQDCQAPDRCPGTGHLDVGWGRCRTVRLRQLLIRAAKHAIAGWGS